MLVSCKLHDGKRVEHIKRLKSYNNIYAPKADKHKITGTDAIMVVTMEAMQGQDNKTFY